MEHCQNITSEINLLKVLTDRPLSTIINPSKQSTERNDMNLYAIKYTGTLQTFAAGDNEAHAISNAIADHKWWDTKLDFFTAELADKTESYPIRYAKHR